jgi:hypothetical protein
VPNPILLFLWGLLLLFFKRLEFNVNEIKLKQPFDSRRRKPNIHISFSTKMTYRK